MLFSFSRPLFAQPKSTRQFVDQVLIVRLRRMSGRLSPFSDPIHMGFLIGQDALLHIVVLNLILLFEPIVQFVFEVIANVLFVDLVRGEVPG